MLDINLIKNILTIGIASGIITTALVQKVKMHLKTKKYICLFSFLISMTVGSLFAISFSDINYIYIAWVGLFSFIGADALYLAFEEKVFKRFSDNERIINIERTDVDIE